LFNGAVPVYDYYDYDAFMSQDFHYSNIPSTFLPTIRLVSPFLLFTVGYVVLWPKFDFDYMLTEEFKQSRLLYKFFFYHISTIL